MPKFEENKKPSAGNNTKETREERQPRGGERKQRSRRGNVASALNMAGDTTRAAQFNKILEELFKDKPDVQTWFKFGHVVDSVEASINYLAVVSEEGEVYTAPVVFETKSGYRRQHDGRESYFTFDLLAQGSELQDKLISVLTEKLEVAEADIIVVDAQIIPPHYKIDEDSVPKVAHIVMTLLDQLTGTAPDDLEIDQFDRFDATFNVNPLNRLPLLNETRSDFSIEVQISKSRQEKWTPSILDADNNNELGLTRLHGYCDLDYQGPEESPETFRGNVESFKSEQFALKNVITAVELAGENNTYGRGLLTIGTLAEAHELESGREVLECRILDKATDLNHLAERMWLPKEVDIPRAKKDEEYLTLLDKMVFKRTSMITFLHRDGDMSSGILHLLSKVGQKDEDYLDVLLAELDNLSPVDEDRQHMSVTNRYAKYLGLKSDADLACEDFVVSYTPRVFGVRRQGDSSYPVEFIDMVQLADITRNDANMYGEMINATSVTDRQYGAADSKEVQVRVLEGINTDLDGVGAEYSLNAEFLTFLGKEIRGLFRTTDFHKFPDRRDGFQTYHRTSGNVDRRMVLGRRDNSSRYDDRGSQRFGSLGRR